MRAISYVVSALMLTLVTIVFTALFIVSIAMYFGRGMGLLSSILEYRKLSIKERLAIVYATYNASRNALVILVVNYGLSDIELTSVVLDGSVVDWSKISMRAADGKELGRVIPRGQVVEIEVVGVAPGKHCGLLVTSSGNVFRFEVVG